VELLEAVRSALGEGQGERAIAGALRDYSGTVWAIGEACRSVQKTVLPERAPGELVVAQEVPDFTQDVSLDGTLSLLLFAQRSGLIQHTATATTGQTSRDGPAASVNVRAGPINVGGMSQVDWAEAVARSLLKKPLPQRWAHSQGVAAQARTLAPILGRYADAVIAAAWLHDVGYAPGLHDSGFHPLDGARYLRAVQHASPLVCQLVAHHSCAAIEAAERGLAADLFRDFKPVSRMLADALVYCDMTTGPQGQPMVVEGRLAEIRSRYGADHVVTRSLARSAPDLAAPVARISQMLAQSSSPCREVHLVPVMVLEEAC